MGITEGVTPWGGRDGGAGVESWSGGNGETEAREPLRTQGGAWVWDRAGGLGPRLVATFRARAGAAALAALWGPEGGDNAELGTFSTAQLVRVAVGGGCSCS